MSVLSRLGRRWQQHRASALVARAEALLQRHAHRPAFDLFVRAARAGHPTAQFQLGRCYLLALGVPASLNQALRWLTAAAQAGDVRAQTQLAELALQGVSEQQPTGLFARDKIIEPTPFWDRAEYWSARAADAGSHEAQALLAFIRSEGPSDRRDFAAAEALYRRSADAGWARAQLGLATQLLRDTTPDRTAEAIKRLQASVAAGLVAARFNLGALAETGASGAIDLAAAAEHYRIAAEAGHHLAQTRYGYALLYGRGLPQNAFAAETWLRRAAVSGEMQAAASLGFLYLNGDSLRHDPSEAALWLEQAAESGNPTAMRVLGRLLLRSRTDWPRALNWLGRAANAGDEGAKADLMRIVTPAQQA